MDVSCSLYQVAVAQPLPMLRSIYHNLYHTLYIVVYPGKSRVGQSKLPGYRRAHAVMVQHLTFYFCRTDNLLCYCVEESVVLLLQAKHADNACQPSKYLMNHSQQTCYLLVAPPEKWPFPVLPNIRHTHGIQVFGCKNRQKN